MYPLKLTDVNLTLGPPAGWTEEQCRTIDAYSGRYDDGTPYVTTAWQPTEADKKAVAEGRPVYLQFVGVLNDAGGPSMMPAHLYTADEHGNKNPQE